MSDSIFKSIPLKRMLAYGMMLALLPMIIVSGLFYMQLENLAEIESSIERMQLLAMHKEKKQFVNKNVRTRFAEADHFYIDKYLESLTFLDSEIQNLEEVSKNLNFIEDESMRSRLEFLTNGQNRLHFTEGALQSTPLFQEVVETAAHPVQVDATDLKKILTYVEGVSIDAVESLPARPQLIFLDFKCDKKVNGQSGDVFLITMKVLKREFQ